jgi:hypothetical protein
MGEGNKINVWWLLLGGSVLLLAGWFMKPFPIFMFIGLAPFFAILDHTIESENFWENGEMILIGLAIFFFAAFQFDTSVFVKILGLAIVFTLPFLGFAYVHENLGSRTGKFIVIIFWLGFEYLLLKIQWPRQTIFLADAFQATSNWFRWNNGTGYLGVSTWVLFANWIFYAGLLRGGVNWFLVILGLVVVAGPIGYSLSLNATPILRSDMIELYKGNSVSVSGYNTKGELVARTCAWLSVLILLFAIVKSSITKK